MEKIGRNARLKTLAVTGSLGSGKTTFCGFLGELGAVIVSADAIVHQLLRENLTLQKGIIHLLGEEILTDQEIDRAKVAEKVFQDPFLLQQLERLLHPRVYEAIYQAYCRAAEQGAPLFVAEIPLLFESGQDVCKDFDKIVTVYAEESISRQRTNKTRTQFTERMARQLPIEEKMRRSNFVVENNQGISHLKHQATQLFNKLVYER